MGRGGGGEDAFNMLHDPFVCDGGQVGGALEPFLNLLSIFARQGASLDEILEGRAAKGVVEDCNCL